MEVIAIRITAAMIMETPSTSPPSPIAKPLQTAERSADAPTTIQTLSWHVCFIESTSPAYCGRGLILAPNLFNTHKKSVEKENNR